jgi:peroxiredoxin (alkyl hydroperoxide reductase subunit C)
MPGVTIGMTGGRSWCWIRQIQAFQHVRATGEVCPSGWQPGKPTLKPGPELVGKVYQVWKPE